MPIDVVMPQMGESVAEGTIVRWIKKVGDSIDRDEPLFEISTDKVDAEIPSPGAGVVLAITVNEGETVPVNSLVAIIGEEGETIADRSAPAAAHEEATSRAPLGGGTETPFAAGDAHDRSSHSQFGDAGDGEVGDGSSDELHGVRSSPVVRKMAREHGIDLGQLTGTGFGGRITKRDVDLFVAHRGSRRHGPDEAAAPTRASGSEAPRRDVTGPPAYVPGDAVRIEKMSVMRRRIAEHMVTSVRTSPHVYSTYEVDFGGIDDLRRQRQAEYEEAGTKLTFTTFIAKATAATLREFPVVNASLDGDDIVYKLDVNLGIAVALEQGLIVPVIRKADERSLLELARSIQDLARRARSKQLIAEDVQGGTFTITNQGVFGAAIGLPIINQPQAAILALGSIEKRAVVIGDRVVARPTCHLTLGFDHRLIDGADGGRFMQALKARLENFDATWL